jgi:hypothetical protein
VVPTAITRRARRTAVAVAAGTANHSAYGGSPGSAEDTPVCSTSVATSIPRAASRRSSRRVIGRPALGISALPGVSACSVRYAESGPVAGHPAGLRRPTGHQRVGQLEGPVLPRFGVELQFPGPV